MPGVPQAESPAASSDAQNALSQERRDWLFCLAQLSRRTGLRAVDVDESLRQEVLLRLHRYGASAELIEAVRQGGARAEQEAGRLFGERLPLGLRLAAPLVDQPSASETM